MSTQVWPGVHGLLMHQMCCGLLRMWDSSGGRLAMRLVILLSETRGTHSN